MAWIKLETAGPPSYPLGNFWPWSKAALRVLRRLIAEGPAPHQQIPVALPDGQLGPGLLYRYELKSWGQSGWTTQPLGWLYATRGHEPELLAERITKPQGVRIV